jgi:hypothetical protein
MGPRIRRNSPLVGKETFEEEYHPLKWKTVLSWEKDGIVTVVRIGRKCFLRREEIEDIIAKGGRQFAGGWRRRQPAS